MDVRVLASRPCGEFTAPPAKSCAHRAIIAAALAEGKSTVAGIGMSDDIRATIGAVLALGAKVTLSPEGGSAEIEGIASAPNAAKINCIESGSTLRFIAPVAAALGVNATFEGEGRLPSRPMHTLTDALCTHNITTDYSGGMPFTIQGQLLPGRYILRGDISSQFISGLMFALPILQGDSEIILTTELQSKPYVDITTAVFSDFGVEIQPTEAGYFIKGGQKYLARAVQVEGDYSGAAFFLAAGALGGNIACRGLNLCSKQGDKEIIELLKRFGARVQADGGSINVNGGLLHGIDIDARQIPDLVPILAVVAAVSEGTTVISGAERLRLKESDRLETVTENLTALGADIKQTEDGLIIRGRRRLRGGTVESCGDHRIAMAMAVAAIKSAAPVIIKNAECVKKSYPDFFGVLKSLGGGFNVFNMGQQG